MMVYQVVALTLVVLCLGATTTFVAIYSRSVWSDSMVGRATMLVWFDMTLVLLWTLVVRLLPAGVAADARIYVGPVIFGILTVSLWWKVWVMATVQRHPDRIEAMDAKLRARRAR